MSLYPVPKTVLRVLLCLACLGGSALASAEPAKSEKVQDLRYGVALYEFFQQSYVDALTELLVGEELGDMPNHEAAAKLLRGGISLSYGIDSEAEKIFKQFLAEHDNPRERDRAWYFLGKMFYLRGENARAAEAFDNIQQPLTDGTLEVERAYMRTNLLLRQGELAKAEAMFATIPEGSPWRPYYYFNLGARHMEAGQWREAIKAFLQFETLNLETEEALALRDRAYTAAGYAWLNTGHSEDAIADFMKVRLHSPLVERAMLGYGWAAAQQEHYQRALGPWQALSRRSVLNVSVQESLLAVPYAYEKLDAQGAALQAYERSVGVFESEIDKLDSAIQDYRDDELNELLALSELHGDDWFSGGEALPVNEQAPYLAHLVSQSSFQLALRDLRDLYNLRDTLRRASERLGIMYHVVQEHQRVWAEKLSATQLDGYHQRLERNRARKARLEEQIEQAQAEPHGLDLLDDETFDLWSRIKNNEALLEKLDTEVEYAEQARKLQLFKGLLVWEASEQYPERIWQLQNQYRDVELAVVQSQRALQNVESIVDSGPTIDFEVRVADLEHRVDLLNSAVDTQVVSMEQYLRELSIAELEQQRERLWTYLSRARLAIARLYDVGSTQIIEEEEAAPLPDYQDYQVEDGKAIDEETFIEKGVIVERPTEKGAAGEGGERANSEPAKPSPETPENTPATQAAGSETGATDTTAPSPADSPETGDRGGNP